jgi:hypothetical protein
MYLKENIFEAADECLSQRLSQSLDDLLVHTSYPHDPRATLEMYMYHFLKIDKDATLNVSRH